ncbi:SubName: Full=Uncharacterized protein {ECO:0000313/EMBL:CCA71811.1} [Serendipita indica DSM 11827]|uniref:Uncharacterized protein n=1 Tax=Serendipita indica (strain DSM 11827) TaxID=1109443 RepID=G4TKH0_SERID|nr:SubName: Full=Uncharacterized protein {ECO:0000313/EMBL:CCA71811.1} [Serendipita indica DSM 11827]CCA71811.1 hypothetical protein PIIN_05746 [Serendipita indica DSM 11827]
MPSDDNITGLILLEENELRFPRFTNEDAYTLGQHIRKRFKATNRWSKGKGVAIAIKSVAGHVLFACTVGESGDVDLESWSCIEGMINTVIKTGHSSYYVERNLTMHGRSPEQIGLTFPEYRLDGGAFPIWLTNATPTPIAVAAAYGDSSMEDHQLVAKSIKDYLIKLGDQNGDQEPLGSPHRRVGSVASMR